MKELNFDNLNAVQILTVIKFYEFGIDTDYENLFKYNKYNKQQLKEYLEKKIELYNKIVKVIGEDKDVEEEDKK